MNFIPEQVKWSIYRRVLISKKIKGFWAHWNTYVDENCIFSPFNRIYKYSRLAYVELGRYSYVAMAAQLGHAKVGSFCSIGPQSAVGGLGKHPTNFLSTHPVFYSVKRSQGITFSKRQVITELPTTYVGNDVWIGSNAIILDGVTVGNGSIIGAGAVVTKDAPSYAILGGVPARIIRYRFSNDVIEALEKWQWWNMPDEVLKNLSVDFSSDKIWTIDEVERIKEKSCNLMQRKEL